MKGATCFNRRPVRAESSYLRAWEKVPGSPLGHQGWCQGLSFQVPCSTRFCEFLHFLFLGSHAWLELGRVPFWRKLLEVSGYTCPTGTQADLTDRWKEDGQLSSQVGPKGKDQVQCEFRRALCAALQMREKAAISAFVHFSQPQEFLNELVGTWIILGSQHLN